MQLWAPWKWIKIKMWWMRESLIQAWSSAPVISWQYTGVRACPILLWLHGGSPWAITHTEKYQAASSKGEWLFCRIQCSIQMSPFCSLCAGGCCRSQEFTINELMNCCNTSHLLSALCGNCTNALLGNYWQRVGFISEELRFRYLLKAWIPWVASDK